MPNQTRFHNRLTIRLLLAMVFMGLGVALVLTLIQYKLNYDRQLEAIEQQHQQILDSIVPSLTRQLWVGEYKLLALQLEGLATLPFMQFVHLQIEDMEDMLAGSHSTDKLKRYSVPLIYHFTEDVRLGTLQYAFNLDQMQYSLLDDLLVIAINQFVVILLISLFMFFLFRLLVMRHLETIANYTSRLDLHSLEKELKLPRPHSYSEQDELSAVVQGINTMRVNILQETEKISALTRSFERFVPKDFLNHLEKKSFEEVQLGDNVERVMTVLFSDLRSFTTLSEGMSPSAIFDCLNRYLGQMGPVVFKHHGFVDKYIGDAIMALFDRKIEDALNAAIEMFYQLRELNQSATNLSSELKMGVGIHTGPMILGTIGERNRLETTVISDVVNVASRLESMTKYFGNQLLISDEVHNNLRSPHAYEIRLIDRVQAKGKSEPVTVFEVFNMDPVPLKEAKLKTIKPFEEGIALFYLKEFQQAKNLFQECLKSLPNDKAVHTYLERCDRWIAARDSMDFAGMNRFTTK